MKRRYYPVLDWNHLKADEEKWHLSASQKAQIVDRCLQTQKRSVGEWLRPFCRPLTGAAVLSLVVLALLFFWPRADCERRVVLSGSKDTTVTEPGTTEPTPNETGPKEEDPPADGKTEPEKPQPVLHTGWSGAPAPALLAASQSYLNKIQTPAALESALTDSDRQNLYQFYRLLLSSAQVRKDSSSADFSGFTLDLLLDPAFTGETLLSTYPLSEAVGAEYSLTESASVPAVADYQGLAKTPLRLTLRLQKSGQAVSYSEAVPVLARVVQYYLSCDPVCFLAINSRPVSSLKGLGALVYSPAWLDLPVPDAQDAQAAFRLLEKAKAPSDPNTDQNRVDLYWQAESVCTSDYDRRFEKYVYYESGIIPYGADQTIRHAAQLTCMLPGSAANPDLAQALLWNAEADGIYLNCFISASNAATGEYTYTFTFYTDASKTTAVDYETARALLLRMLRYALSCPAVTNATVFMPALDYTGAPKAQIDAYAD